MAEDLRKNNIKIILVQTWEAHTKAEWTIGHPKETENQQQSLAERVERAKTFLAQYGKVYPVYVDKWDNEFETKFRAWPDKYYCVDRNMKVIAKSVYNKGGSLDAMIKKDYTILLRELMNK